MTSAKLVIIFVALLSTIKGDFVSNLPVVGPVLGSITNITGRVVHSTLDTVQQTGEDLLNNADGIGIIIETRIRELMEQFRTMMLGPIVSLGFPQLEPLDIKHIDIDIDHEIGQFKGTMNNVRVKKLSTFKLEEVEVVLAQLLPPTPNVTLYLYFEELDITGDYDIQAEVGELFHVYGKGPFSLKLHDIFVDANVVLAYNILAKEIRIKDVNVFATLGSLECNFENLMGGGEAGALFNKVIAQIAPEAVEVLWPEIRPLVEEKVKENGNSILERIPLDIILDILLPKSIRHLIEQVAN